MKFRILSLILIHYSLFTIPSSAAAAEGSQGKRSQAAEQRTTEGNRVERDRQSQDSPGGGRPAGSINARSTKPNVIYILLDEWGYFEWSKMGHAILETPNIDQLASEGMRFTQFLAGASVCAPTRSTLMTGQHTGHTTVRGPGCLRADDVTIANNLKDAGYATGGFGKWGLGEPGTTGVDKV